MYTPKFFLHIEVDEGDTFDFNNLEKNIKPFFGGSVDSGFNESKDLKALYII